MKKLIQIFLILTIALACFMNISVLATNTTDTNSATNNIETTQPQNNVNTSSPSSTTTQVTSVSSANEGPLSISDILNILLIATGIVIILLAIAILTKLK